MMTPFKKYLFHSVRVLFFAVSVLFLSSGCGYHIGSMMHPQVKSIAISFVRNDTKEFNASATMRQQLAEAFQVDGSLKLKSQEQADCILYCRIIEVKNTSVRWDSQDDDQTYRPSEFNIAVTAEFTVLIPGQSEPLIKTRTVTGSARYQYMADPAVGRIYGMRQACYNLSRKIVQYTTEAW